MNEREMLEMAAKAAGKWKQFSKIVECVKDWDSPHKNKMAVQIGSCSADTWNSLVDDADALRLAVKLDMQIIVNRVDGFVRVIAGYNGDIVIEEDFGDDMYAATRRAITRAAAQIGKAMP